MLQPVDKTKIKYWSFNSDIPVEVTPTTIFKQADKSLPVVILIHGWQDQLNKDVITSLAEAYKLYKQVNFIVVDWTEYTNNVFLIPTMLHATYTGKALGQFIQQVSKSFVNEEDRQTFFKQLHLLGLTMGAYVAGSASNYLQIREHRMINRITAFDAFAPVFAFPYPLPCRFRLCKTHATFVDAIHSDILLLGATYPFGHADFYVNFGGPIQPGCWKNFIPKFLPDSNISKHLSIKFIIWIDCSTFCSQMQSLKSYRILH